MQTGHDHLTLSRLAKIKKNSKASEEEITEVFVCEVDDIHYASVRNQLSAI